MRSRFTEDPLAPLLPTPDRPFDVGDAAHLVRRSAFGGTPDEIDHVVGLGPTAAADHFVDFVALEPALLEAIAATGSELAPPEKGESAITSFERMRREWIFRMVHTEFPLREKLTLFWHDHFACQASKVVRPILVQQQIYLFRALGGDSFRDLVRGVARDAAMLVFLDNRISVKENPNENWARELLELFTVGLDQYTQPDIVALSRIFTGWTTPRSDSPEFTFDPLLHDTAAKTLFETTIDGKSGAEGVDEGDAAIDRILARAACPEFLAGKLLRWFAHPNPPVGVVSRLAEVLRDNELSIREGLRTLFRSEWFYAPSNRFALYKNPIEMVVGAARFLGIQNAHLAGLERHSRNMGMDLFEPPSVAGWDHGDAWANSSTTVARMQFALSLSEIPHTSRRATGRATIDLDRITTEPSPVERSRSVARRLLATPLDSSREAALVTYQEGVALRMKGDTATHVRRAQTRALIHLLMATPEFALA